MSTRGSNKSESKPLATTSPSDLLSTKEFGKLLGVTGATAARWIREGTIPTDGYIRLKGGEGKRGHYRVYRYSTQYVLSGD